MDSKIKSITGYALIDDFHLNGNTVVFELDGKYYHSIKVGKLTDGGIEVMKERGLIKGEINV